MSIFSVLQYFRPEKKIPPTINEDKVISAMTAFQRKARQRFSRKIAIQNTQWKLFSSLDCKDEAEIVNLACFMQTLLDKIPFDNAQSKVELNSEHENISLDSIQVSVNEKLSGDPTNFTINSKTITPEVARELVNLYQHGGRLSEHSVIKILRASYRSLTQLPNINRVSIAHGVKLTMVGDTHGQLSDLLHIINESGMPSSTNKYIFNGDFVDRGDYGLEILLLMLTFHAAFPQDVFLNRGNHEDLTICRTYGFENEVLSKYKTLIFGMIIEIFKYLPLCSVVNDQIFVVHGGLTHDSEVDFDTINDIPRHLFETHSSYPGYLPERLESLSSSGLSELARNEYLFELMRDLLWSDPKMEMGCNESHRGLGVQFGPDVTDSFLRANNLKMIVRSHECVPSGFELPHCSSHHRCLSHQSASTLLPILTNHIKNNNNNNNNNSQQQQSEVEVEGSTAEPFLCTLFSASNYGRSNNHGAYLVFLSHPTHGSCPVDLYNTPSPSPIPTSFSSNSQSDLSSSTSSSTSSSFVQQSESQIDSSLLLPTPPPPPPSTSSSLTPSTSSFSTESTSPSVLPLHPSLHFTIHRFRTSSCSLHDIQQQNILSLTDLILFKKPALSLAFESEDILNSGYVTRNQWSEIMSRITNISILWLSLIHSLVPSIYLTSKNVAYRGFLEKYSLHMTSPLTTTTDDDDDNDDEELDQEGKGKKGNGNDMNQKRKITSTSHQKEGDKKDSQLLDLMYAQRKRLEAIFRYFDTNGDGVISREEFRLGCQALEATCISPTPTTPSTSRSNNNPTSEHSTTTTSSSSSYMMNDDGDEVERWDGGSGGVGGGVGGIRGGVGVSVLGDWERVLSLMDLDSSGDIDINEFFEVFRILDAKDGKADGVLSLAHSHNTTYSPR